MTKILLNLSNYVNGFQIPVLVLLNFFLANWEYRLRLLNIIDMFYMWNHLSDMMLDFSSNNNFHLAIPLQDTVFDPVALTCGHIFCYTCACSAASVTIVNGLQAADPKEKCPLCREVKYNIYQILLQLHHLHP